tara:strand:+ start:1011 stop:1277 length:267 start_codon:yes stop_codon:yes gene_type:complete
LGAYLLTSQAPHTQKGVCGALCREKRKLQQAKIGDKNIMKGIKKAEIKKRGKTRKRKKQQKNEYKRGIECPRRVRQLFDMPRMRRKRQ